MSTRTTTVTVRRNCLVGLVLSSTIVCTAACSPTPVTSVAGETDAPVITAPRQPAPGTTGGAAGVIVYFTPDSPASGDESLREKTITDAATRAGVEVSRTSVRRVDHSGETSVVIAVEGGLNPQQLSRFIRELYAAEGVVHVDPDTGSVPSGDTAQ